MMKNPYTPKFQSKIQILKFSDVKSKQMKVELESFVNRVALEL